MAAYAQACTPAQSCITMSKAVCGPTRCTENHPRSIMPPIKRTKISQASAPEGRDGPKGETGPRKSAALLNLDERSLLSPWQTSHGCADVFELVLDSRR